MQSVSSIPNEVLVAYMYDVDVMHIAKYAEILPPHCLAKRYTGMQTIKLRSGGNEQAIQLMSKLVTEERNATIWDNKGAMAGSEPP